MLKHSIHKIYETVGGSSLGHILEFLRSFSYDSPEGFYSDVFGGAHLATVEYAKIFNAIHDTEIAYSPAQLIDSLALCAASQALIFVDNEVPSDSSELGGMLMAHTTILKMIYGDAHPHEMYATVKEAYSILGVYLEHIIGVHPQDRLCFEASLRAHSASKQDFYLEACCAYRRYRAMSTGKNTQKMVTTKKVYEIFDALHQEHMFILRQRRDFVAETSLDASARDALFTVYSLLRKEL